MPLIEIVRRQTVIHDRTIIALTEALASAASAELSCEDGGVLKPSDIMFEVRNFSPFDRHCKDLHIRVLAHDYPSRRGEDNERLEAIQQHLSGLVADFVPAGASWYVWVLLSLTSYGSDTES
jgi:hypothetical protein